MKKDVDIKAKKDTDELVYQGEITRIDYDELSQYSIQGRTESRAKPLVLVVLHTRI